MTALSILFVGLLLGMKHATETDHLAAVATLVTRAGSWLETLRLGAAWGLGHTITLLAFGAIALALGRAISPHLEQALEFCVGLMLIVLGLDVLRRLVRQRIHLHVHQHDDYGAHIHAHSHAGEADAHHTTHRHEHPTLPTLPIPGRPNPASTSASAARRAVPNRTTEPRRFPLRALAVGMMHGMAGSAALLLLSLQTVRSWQLGILYIACFGIGSMLGMALLSVVISVPLKLSAGYLQSLHKGITAIFGAFSCGLGAFTAYHIGIVEGLLQP